MITIKETKLADKLAHLKTKDELMIEGLIQDEKEMYDEENQYRDFVDIRFNKHFDYYFNIIWDLKEEPI
jgi:hypothetical protein